jgi:GAF domain-containing protein
MPHRAPEPESLLAQALRDAEETAREQMAAAWQLQMERLQEALAGSWSESVEHIFAERFAGLRARIEADVRDAVERRVAEEIARKRREASEDLSLAVRQLRYFESEAQWCAALLNSAAGFAPRAALFAVTNQAVRYLGFRGEAPVAPESGPSSPVDTELPLADAPAFWSAVESCDTIVSAATPRELSPAIAAFFGADAARRVYLMPLFTRDRVIAVLYAEEREQAVDVRGLELLAALAAASIEAHLALQQLPKRSNVVPIAAPPAAARPAGGPPPEAGWSALSKEEQELHLSAQRFARVKVAELRLYKSNSVKAGRTQGDLYGALEAEINQLRADYRERYLALTPTMLDYLHAELVRSLANDDPKLLGPRYPGALT